MPARQLQIPAAVVSSIIGVIALAAVGSAEARRTQTVSFHAPADEAWPERPDRTYITATTATVERLVSIRDDLILGGARNVNLFIPDNVIVAELPRSVDLSHILSVPGVRLTSERDVGPRASSSEARRVNWIREAYRAAEQMPRARAAGADATAAPPGAGSDVPVDMVLRISPERLKAVQRDVESRRPDLAPASDGANATRSMANNSEILTGKVLAQFVYPESNGSREPSLEDWGEDIGQAVSGTTAMMLDFQGQYPSMNIHVTFVHYKGADCDYEPIEHNSQTDGVWIVNTMRKLGYGVATSDPLATVHEFNLDKREQYATDWVFTSFIANARNAPNHRFKNAGYTAYAYLGGPYNVNPHPAGTDPNDIGEFLVFSQIVQHETGHTFWTLDEYPGAPSPCTARSGYLDYPNLNLTDVNGPGGAVRCSDEVPCIMHSAARLDLERPFCEFSQGMLGVIDDNGNRIPDVFESEPIIEFAVEGPETSQTGGITLRFQAISTAVPNQNSNQQPPENRVDYAAPLKDGFYSFGIEQAPLVPDDGRWDEAVEDFSLRFNLLPVGTTLFEFRVRSTSGLSTPWYKKYVHFIGVNYAQLSIYPRRKSIEVTWNTVGQTWGATFDLYRQAEGETEWTKVANDVPPGQPQSGFTPYRVVDRSVRAGQDYRYFVEASFALESGGVVRQYNPASNIVSTTAMIPITAGSILSRAAPNPFNNEVTVSVSIPKTFETKNATSASGASISYEQRVATPVDVAVYDVRGRRIRELSRTTEFLDVITLKWDGRDSRGRRVPNGVYFIKARAGEEFGSRKVLMVR